jgi:hypothetical protein
MLRIIATDRTPLQLAPEPIRMLVLSVYDAAAPASASSDRMSPDATGAATDATNVMVSTRTLEARLSSVVGDAEPTVHLVRVGDQLSIGARHFLVTTMHESSPLGSCVELDQVTPPAVDA